jgi:hypothetical protein
MANDLKKIEVTFDGTRGADIAAKHQRVLMKKTSD